MKKLIEDQKPAEGGESKQVLSYGVVNGTTLKYASGKEWSTKFKLGNSTFLGEVGFKPAKFNNDD